MELKRGNPHRNLKALNKLVPANTPEGKPKSACVALPHNALKQVVCNLKSESVPPQKAYLMSGSWGPGDELRGGPGRESRSKFSALSRLLFIAYHWPFQLHACRRASAHLQVKYPTTMSVSRVSFIISPSSYIAFPFEYPRSISTGPISARARRRTWADSMAARPGEDVAATL